MQPAAGLPSTMSVLIVDAQSEIADDFIERFAGRDASGVVHSTSGQAARRAAKQGAFDLVVASLDALADLGHGPEAAVGQLAQVAHGAIIIALSEDVSVSATMAAMRGGAHDCLARPTGATTLLAVANDLARRHSKAVSSKASAPTGDTGGGSDDFVGVSAQAELLRRQISRLSHSPAPVFVTGEAGAGKSLCAELIHRVGGRAGNPLISFDCGVQTSADLDTCAVEAEGGTLLVRHVDALDASGQKALLGLIETGPQSSNDNGGMSGHDVHLICTTRANPAQLTSSRALREDLYFRLNVLALHVPPLRQRAGDVVALARHFGAMAAAEIGMDFHGVSADAAAELEGRRWPGNVAQLRDVIRHAVGSSRRGRIDIGMLMPSANGTTAQTAGAILPLWRQERRIIESALARFDGNIAQAAEALEISPSTIYRKLQSWDDRVAGAA